MEGMGGIKTLRKESRVRKRDLLPKESFFFFFFFLGLFPLENTPWLIRWWTWLPANPLILILASSSTSSRRVCLEKRLSRIEKEGKVSVPPPTAALKNDRFNEKTPSYRLLLILSTPSRSLLALTGIGYPWTGTYALVPVTYERKLLYELRQSFFALSCLS